MSDNKRKVKVVASKKPTQNSAPAKTPTVRVKASAQKTPPVPAFEHPKSAPPFAVPADRPDDAERRRSSPLPTSSGLGTGSTSDSIGFTTVSSPVSEKQAEEKPAAKTENKSDDKAEKKAEKSASEQTSKPLEASEEKVPEAKAETAVPEKPTANPADTSDKKAEKPEAKKTDKTEKKADKPKADKADKADEKPTESPKENVAEPTPEQKPEESEPKADKPSSDKGKKSSKASKKKTPKPAEKPEEAKEENPEGDEHNADAEKKEPQVSSYFDAPSSPDDGVYSLKKEQIIDGATAIDTKKSSRGKEAEKAAAAAVLHIPKPAKGVKKKEKPAEKAEEKPTPSDGGKKTAVQVRPESAPPEPVAEKPHEDSRLRRAAERLRAREERVALRQNILDAEYAAIPSHVQKWREMPVVRIIIMVLSILLMIFSFSPLIVGVKTIGILPPFCIGAFFFLCARYWNLIIGCRKWYLNALFSAVGVGVLLGIVLMAYISGLMVNASLRAPHEDGDPYTVVVLGCRIYEDRPSRMLVDRLTAACEYLQAHPQAHCVVTGGQGDDEPEPEAAVMKRWLVEHGISSMRIVTETKSTSTEENIDFTVALMDEYNLHERIVIVSDRFHQYRAQHYAEKHGVEACAICTETRWYLVMQYWFREMAGIVEMHLSGR